MNRFDQKVAIVTGAGSGIGFEIVRQLLANGANVVLNDLDPETTHEACFQLKSTGPGRCVARVGDAADPAFCYELVAFAVEQFGQLDMAVANAGITHFSAFLEATPAMFEAVVNLNLRGTFFLAQAATKQFRIQGSGGNLLLMSSNIGYQAYPNLTIYAMTKAGIRMLARNLVAELSPLGVRINAIAPGATLTERTAVEEADYWGTWSQITPLNQIATPPDIANTALFLLSDDSRHITGQTILVDGGWEAVSMLPKSNRVALAT
jgi:glucose 1-dehydrogenase